MDKQQQIINDFTGMNAVPVHEVVTPTTVEEVRAAVHSGSGAISIGGGRFSMGGQIASPGSLHLDMRKLNQVVNFSPLHRTIRVQAGIRWCDIQRLLDPLDLSVKIMQTYANFTVGGSLSVNVHGRYVGLGPLILSVRSIAVVLVDGTLVEASRSDNAEIFFAVIGGYGGLGVIVEAELDLARNTRVERVQKKLATGDYIEHFRALLRGPQKPVFHNADLYPPHYNAVRSVTWMETEKPVTEPHRLLPVTSSYRLQKYFLWAISETPTGKWRREFIVDPILYAWPKVHWRNFEAGYDVAELEPAFRMGKAYILQEYFIPFERFEEFVPKMAEILQRHRVNVINVSVRHAVADPGSCLAWARREVFAFVLFYKQRVSNDARAGVAVWTRALIDAALSVDGAYYLPYQAHATPEQFHKAFPRAHEFFALKRKLDPQFRLRNVIWDTYYAPTFKQEPATMTTDSDFQTVYSDVASQDAFYAFLQHIYRIYPEDKFHSLIKQACADQSTDEAIYRHIQAALPGIKTFLADLFYALPALKKQKREMSRQTLELLGDRKDFDGYVEIGSTGRYISDLRKHIRLRGPIILVNDEAPTHSPVDIMERGQLAKLGRFVAMNNYQPIGAGEIANDSVDLMTCYIGLHHAPLELLDPFVRSLWRILRPGGLFILRDHDVKTPRMNSFVSLVHTVFNVGLDVAWNSNREEVRNFVSVDEWVAYLEARGFKDHGQRLLQAHDPSDNTLIAFTKTAPEPAP